MISFDYFILKKFIFENIDFLTNARLQKIQQPNRQELVFSMRNKGETRKFYINTNPKFFHVCFVSAENEKKRHIEIPQKPPMFCMLLRKYLESAKIARICQPDEERILEFYFETYNELGEKIYLCLAIELMGKHSNVILYSYDTNIILGCLHNVGAEKSSVRELMGGLPYAYPPKNVQRKFSGLSDLYTASSHLPVNEFIDNYFADLQEEEKIKILKSRLLTVTKSKLKKIHNTLLKIEKQSLSEKKADNYRKKGDLIMANLFHHKDFSRSIEVIDYETNSLLIIELDEAQTLKENANRFYKLYNKSKTAAEKTQELIKNLTSEREYLESVLYSIEETQTYEDLVEIEEEINNEGKKSRGQEGRQFSRHPELGSGSHKRTTFNIFQVRMNNFTIYIGKNNKQNDYIVSKLARSEDIWFHTHNCAGSHVLLRVEAGQKVTDEIIFECAKLAKEYSSAKMSSKVGVIYTFAKNLKKPPKANLGYVIYKGEKEIIVD